MTMRRARVYPRPAEGESIRANLGRGRLEISDGVTHIWDEQTARRGVAARSKRNQNWRWPFKGQTATAQEQVH